MFTEAALHVEAGQSDGVTTKMAARRSPVGPVPNHVRFVELPSACLSTNTL